MTNLQTWPDAELCQFCVPRRWEDRLESAGCIATPVVSAVFLIVWYVPRREDASFLEGVAIWVAGTLLLQWVLHVIAGLRSRRHMTELARRYRQRAFGVYWKSARRELKGKAARKIYLFQGRDIEGKQCAFVKVMLQGTEPASGRLTVRIAPDFQTVDFETVSSGDLVSRERELTPEEATALLTWREGSAGSRPRSAPKNEKDEKGFACSVATLEASSESMATCDLLSMKVLEADPFALQLTLRMLHLAETVTDHPLVRDWEMPGKKEKSFRLDMSEESGMRLFQKDAPPDWVILFDGSALPHGGHHTLRVVLSEAEPHRGRLWTVAHAYKRFDRRDPRSTEAYHEKELSATSCQSILGELHSITPQPDMKLPSFAAYDGFPCNLVVLRRSPSEVTRVECNLAGLGEDQAQEPSVKLMHLLLDLRREPDAEPVIYGACDAFGNIQIGEI